MLNFFFAKKASHFCERCLLLISLLQSWRQHQDGNNFTKYCMCHLLVLCLSPFFTVVNRSNLSETALNVCAVFLMSKH